MALGATNQNGGVAQGAALSYENVQRFLVQPLAEQSIILASGVQIIDSANKVRLPVAPNVNENLDFVGENQQIPETNAQFGAFNLLPSTMESVKDITRYSNELRRQSVVSVDQALQSNLVTSVAAKVDNALIAGNGDGVTTPKGLLNFAGTQTHAVGGSLDVDDIYDSIQLALLAHVQESDLRLWIRPETLTALRKLKTGTGEYLLQQDPTQAGRSTVAGVPVTVTTRIPVSGGQTPSTQAVLWAPRFTYVVRDASPTVAFLTERYADFDQFGIRVTARYDIGTPQPETVVKLTGITV